MTGVVWTVADLAAAAGVTTGRVRQLLRAGRLRGQKVGGRWLVADADALGWLASERRTGRPPAGTEGVKGQQLRLDDVEGGQS